MTYPTPVQATVFFPVLRLAMGAAESSETATDASD